MKKTLTSLLASGILASSVAFADTNTPKIVGMSKYQVGTNAPLLRLDIHFPATGVFNIVKSEDGFNFSEAVNTNMLVKYSNSVITRYEPLNTSTGSSKVSYGVKGLQ